ncbi:hypothetical protein AAP_01985 [Ascosphaera apis ARSEF 7405]|uniref:Uncharacterized protein n=1 Tax=Ascosphaera apis ARSEF 7405 TaxID=392613 RepID=A0A168AGC0_9EURO|nr:hypothetical protein AAP_01985 [Ascosphaera apis ARSEF 7405]
MPLSVRNSTSQSLPQRVHPEMSGSPLLNGNNNNEVKGLPDIEPNPEHLLRPRTSHHDPPPPPSPSLKTVRSSDNGCPSDDGTGEKPNRVRSRNDSIRSQGTASSAEQLNELRKSLTRERSNIAGIEELDGKIDLRQLLTLACSHPLFKYLKQQRRIERLTYSDEDKRYLYDETPSVAGCAGPELRPLRGKGLWSVRRLANLDTKGLVGGVLDAFAGLLSFFDGTEGMEDLRCQNETETRLDEADEETSNDGMKKKLRRFAVACQIRIDEHKTLMVFSFFSNVMSRYEPISARRKLAGLVAELKPPSPLPPLHIHPEVKLLYHLTTTRTPTARHIGVSSPACIPCTVLFTIWNEIHGQSFHISGVSIVNNGNDTEEPLDPEQKSLFGGKKTELGNGKYSASWTVPREWRDTELLERTQEELEVRIGEALLREVDYRRSLDGDDGWWEPEDDQPVPDLRMLIRSVQAKSKEIEIENENQHLGAGDQGLVKRRRERPPTRQTKQMNQSKLSRQERIETTQPEKSTKKPALSKKMKKAKWSFMDPTTACESQ